MPTTAEDRDEILQLLYRYNHLIDGGDADGWGDTFTEDAVFDAAGNVLTGRDALKGFAVSVAGVGRHLVLNPVIDVNGDTATSRAYLMLVAGGAIAAVGSYADELVRTPEGWKFAKRVFTMDAPAGA